jgi:tetratricopeptide (TPR) repeat protein
MLKKDNEKALLLRKEGNELYKEKKFFEALLKYNESLCFAEPGSEHLGFGFANRSAVYFEMKLYNKALENVEFAIENNYPKTSMEILTTRKEKCKKNLKQQQENKNNFFKLKSKGNEKIPFVSENLELREDEKFGRHIVTNKRLVVGEVIAIEKPFVSVPIGRSNDTESNKFQRCNSCLRDNLLDLIPCENCCDGEFSRNILKLSYFFKKI